MSISIDWNGINTGIDDGDTVEAKLTNTFTATEVALNDLDILSSANELAVSSNTDRLDTLVLDNLADTDLGIVELDSPVYFNNGAYSAQGGNIRVNHLNIKDNITLEPVADGSADGYHLVVDENGNVGVKNIPNADNVQVATSNTQIFLQIADTLVTTAVLNFDVDASDSTIEATMLVRNTTNQIQYINITHYHQGIATGTRQREIARDATQQIYVSNDIVGTYLAGDTVEVHASASNAGALVIDGNIQLSKTTYTKSVAIVSSSINANTIRIEALEQSYPSEFTGISLATTQEPTTTDTTLQIEFGSAQAGLGSATLDALGAITFLETRRYLVNININYGRNGGIGESDLFGRLKLNGIQYGTTMYTSLDNSKIVIPRQLSFSINAIANDVLTLEIVRASSGDNSGGLFSYQPSLVGWNLSPSASATVIKV